MFADDDDDDTMLPNTRPPQSAGGLISVEAQRAVAEVQARMMIARANPRDPRQCAELIENDCQRMAVAEHALYEYSRAGTKISGPSIHLAEAIARRWGNVASGIKEVTRGDGFSEYIAYAWDLESGYYDERQFHVRHWIDTKGGGRLATTERDIYELGANMGQRRKRAVLLTVLPTDIVEMAERTCEKTLRAKADTGPEALKRMEEAFAEFGVTRAQLEARIQRRLDAISPAQMVSLKRIYQSLRDEMSKAADWFAPVEGEPAAALSPAAQRAREAILAKAASKGKKPAAAETPQAGQEQAPGAAEGSAAGQPPAATTEGPAGGPSGQAAVQLDEQQPAAEQLRERIMKAKDRDAAWLVMDAARGNASLTPQDHESLVDLIDQRFPEGGQP